ncbi:MAG TPA: SDR family oxidoreductase [Symbiobacteriaceae bacterium]|nr:SDR family oxidoreductase [Symbiobacteriaceae bacterium]
MQLTGRTTFITGAAGGLGAACARLFAAAGAQLLLVDRSEQVHDLAAELGAQAIACVGDVTSSADLDRAVRLALDQTGRVDHLIACAGVIHAGSLVETTAEAWSRVIGINLTGLFLTCQAVLPTMVAQRAGSIVTFASQYGLVAAPRLAAYCAAKGGVVQLTRSMALDYEAYNIRANCLCPGMTETRMLQDVFAQLGASREWSVLLRAMPKPIERPEQIAEVALFLASERAAAMNGATVLADGGYTAR